MVLLETVKDDGILQGEQLLLEMADELTEGIVKQFSCG